MDKGGYIRLSRKFFKNKYWLKERTYNQAEAWLDLIQMARFEAEPQNKVLPGGRQVVIERGEIHSSLRFLSARWGWGIMQVRTFLKSCASSQQITQRMTQGESIITLCKYDEYNPLFISNNTPDNTPDNTPPEPVTSCKRDGCNPPFFDDNTPDNTPLNTPVTHPYHTGNTNTNKGNKVKKEKKEKESIPDGICRDAPDAVPVSFKNFIAGFNAVRGSKFQAIEKARRQFNARLKEGFTPDQMIQALKTAMKEKNHIESGYKYLTPEFITRPDKLERFLNSNAGKGERMSEEDFLKRLNGE